MVVIECATVPMIEARGKDSEHAGHDCGLCSRALFGFARCTQTFTISSIAMRW
jgi:hypothetical protein